MKPEKQIRITVRRWGQDSYRVEKIVNAVIIDAPGSEHGTLTVGESAPSAAIESLCRLPNCEVTVLQPE